MLTNEELEQLVAQCAITHRPHPEEAREVDERRHDLRWQVYDIFTTVFYMGQEYCLPVPEISVSGIRIVNAPPGISPGRRVLLLLPLNEHGILAVNAEVIHVGHNGKGHYAGLKFLPTYLEEMTPLVNYMTQLWVDHQRHCQEEKDSTTPPE